MRVYGNRSKVCDGIPIDVEHFNSRSSLGRTPLAKPTLPNTCRARDQAQPAIRPGEPHRLESVLFARCGIHNQGAAVVVIRCHSRYHYLTRGIALTLVASGIAAGPVTLTEAGAQTLCEERRSGFSGQNVNSAWQHYIDVVLRNKTYIYVRHIWSQPRTGIGDH